MSRKPTIKISYPDASDVAMKLTEAMVRRAPGRRVVETTSEDSASPAGGELFADFDACSTSTSVDLTLTLNSASMDYALETLIRPNLTADERKRILGEDAEQTELALTPSEQKKIDASAEQLANELIIEPEKKIEIGKITDADLRIILADLVDAAQGYVQGGQDAWGKHIENAIETAIKEIDYRAGVIEEENPVLIQEDTTLLDMLSVLICGAMRVNNKRITELKIYATNVAHYLNDGLPDDKNVFVVAARNLASALFSVQHDFTEDANRTLDAELLVRKNKRIDEETEAQSNKKPSWDDVEAEARQIGQHKTNETNETDDIEPGLLNDINDGEDGEEE